MPTPVFPNRTTKAEIELGAVLQPKFGPDGLIPCITQDAATGEVLMFAFMNAESLAHTLRTRKATYWSRSRGKLWTKGEESGNFQAVQALLTDCDQDVLLLKVEQKGTSGAACHNGYRSCFYRRLADAANPDDATSLSLEFTAKPVVDPGSLYRK